MRVEGAEDGRSQRAIASEFGGAEQTLFFKTKLEELRRNKERQNKFDRRQIAERLESLKKLRSAPKGARALEEIRRVVWRLQRTRIRSFSRKVE